MEITRFSRMLVNKEIADECVERSGGKPLVLVKAIMKDDDEYVSDTLVIPSYLAKGLEFDVVIIYNSGNGNYCYEEERLLLYAYTI